MQLAMVRFLKIVCCVLAGIGFSGMAAATYIGNRQVVNAPRAPNFDTGEINAFFTKGIYIYLDDFDFLVEIYLFNVMLVLFLLAVGMLRWLENKMPKQ